MPSMVKPVTHETPEKIPRTTTTNRARTRFCSKERTTKRNPATHNAAPKSRRLENCEKIFGPRAIPIARPVKTALKRIPYAASPPARSPTNVRASPITAPAAIKAPRRPNIKPLITLEDDKNFPPSSSEAKIEVERSPLFRCSFGISIWLIVHALKRKDKALINRAKSTAELEPRLKAALIPVIKRVSRVKVIAAKGALP
jgi:hypothetical protein